MGGASSIGAHVTRLLAGSGRVALAAGYELRTTTLPVRTFDVPANVLDSRKSSAVSGWTPSVDFPQGIQRSWRSVLDGLYR